MNITINQLERNTADGEIITAHWNASVEETHVVPESTDSEGNVTPETTVVDYSASAYGSESFTIDEDSPDFVVFEDLTEDIVVGWLTLDDGLEDNLLAQIEEQKNPTTVTGKPWDVVVSEEVA